MNFARIIERWAAFRPESTALRCGAEEVSYGALWTRIEAATKGLARELAIRPGDRVAYLGANDVEMLVLFFALARLGGVFVPLNFRLAAPELERMLAHSQTTVLVADPDFAKLAEALRPRLDTVCALRNPPPGWRDWASIRTASGATPLLTGDDSQPLLVVYTSGTTGLPKGAVHTQEAMMWNCVCAAQCHDFTHADHALVVLPMFHIGGLCIQTLPLLHAGGTVTVHPRFDPGLFLADVARLRPDVTMLVPATARAAIEHPGWASADLSSLRLVNMGSQIVPLAYIDAFHARGIDVIQVYGATETGPVSIHLRREHARRKPGSCGMPAVHVQARIVDSAGADVPRGAVGEIWLAGKNMMRGYLNDPHNPSFQDGWFRTGDLARVDDDGFYWVVGRSKDMIVSGGENIYPAEIENELAAVPDILESAVIGVPDDRWGEACVAVVVKKPASTLDAAGVLARLEGRIARFKMPRKVVFAAELPKTALGKVQKSALAGIIEGAQ